MKTAAVGSSLGRVVVSVLVPAFMVLSPVRADTAPYDTTPLQYQETTRPIQTSGQLTYKATQKLSFKTSGPVASIQVDESDTVEKDQLLASLNTEEVEAQVAEAEARHQEALRNHQRLQRLHRQQAISLDQLQAAQTSVDVAESRLRIARFNNRYSHIRAPGRGRIIERLIEPGELISPQQTAFLLADEAKGWIMRTGLSDRDVVRVQTGDPATIHFDAYPGASFTGRVTEIAPAADSRTGTFDLEISLDSPPKRLYQGFIGRITVTPAESQRIARLPANALVSADNGQGIIYVADPASERIIQHRVDILWLDNQSLAIESSLPEGTPVITRGASFLKPDDNVQSAPVANRQ
ncbi:efflux RND transporter periplasmic adaptor subunit [Kistimonas asteriae]|uniref:efflux RND transporter periplasmic adaptor subunit n=1 Tax=Kistimonas asteriae TaxID=517724 RepID=UPI001BA689FA